jgi:hypothetical protein
MTKPAIVQRKKAEDINRDSSQKNERIPNESCTYINKMHFISTY